MSKELIMLGTGNAAARHCYNTCFLIRNEAEYFLVDGGGGNTVLNQLDAVGVSCKDIHALFVTHTHTDHLFGVVWIIRTIAQMINQKRYTGTLRIYTHDKVIHTLRTICSLTLPPKIQAQLDRGIVFHELTDGDGFTECGIRFQSFDIHSRKEKQFGFRATFADGTTLACLGDEPFNEQNRSSVEGVDWLLCEAFCLYRDREEFSPYEKHHSTARDAGCLAQTLNVKHLLLYHTEDHTLDERKQAYTHEAAQVFDGEVCVPDDLETVSLD